MAVVQVGRFAVVLLFCAAVSPSMLQAQDRGSFGFGIGIPYGVIGANAELNTGNYLAVSAGIGHTIVAGVGYSAGLRGYFRPPDAGFRPRASLFYGTAFVADDLSENGLTVGIGGRSMFGATRRHGVDYDILLTVAPSASSVEEEFGGESVGTPVKLSIGYRLSF